MQVEELNYILKNVQPRKKAGKKEERSKQMGQIVNSKMVDLNSTMSIITLNGKNISIKQRQTENKE